MSTSTSAPTTPGDARKRNLRWRVVDIVVASVLGVAIGLLFWVWNSVGGFLWGVFGAATPGLGGLAAGVWFIGGVIGGLVIRKPGAAIFVETLAAAVSATIGNEWGVTTIFSGLAQGLGAELILALFLYRSFGLGAAILAGAAAGLGAWTLELFVGKTPNILMTWDYNLIYLGATVVSGAVLAGLLGWLLVRALAATGALNRFAVGREGRSEI